MAAAQRLLRAVLTQAVRTGSLAVALPDGARLHVGRDLPPEVEIRLTDWKAVWALAINPDLRLGELYTDGRLVVDKGSFYDFLDVALRDGRGRHPAGLARLAGRLRYTIRRFIQINGPARAQRNVAHHYDLKSHLYELFLDRDMQYSCAYFEHEGQSLDDAQLAKKRHIAAKLMIEPGQRVLDIGSGWGGLGLYLAGTAGAQRVTGITLSREQLAISREHARARGLEDRVSFEFADYRAVTGPFERIVSVGMFEHVGIGYYDTFFAQCRRLLAEDGVMVLHHIANCEEPAATNPWIVRYIFPGGHLPALSEVAPAIERSGLIVTDIEVLPLHYAATLRHWRERFLSRRKEAMELYDERFCRMWEAYLAMSEAGFRHQDLAVLQIQLARRHGIVPLTRGYIAEREAQLREAERATPQPAMEPAG